MTSIRVTKQQRAMLDMASSLKQAKVDRKRQPESNQKKCKLRNELNRIHKKLFAQTTQDERVRSLGKMIRDSASKSPDGIARLPVLRELLDDVQNCLETERQRGGIGIAWLLPSLNEIEIKARLYRLVVLPFGWKNPARPKKEKFFSLADEREAYRHAQEQTDKGYFVRVVTLVDRIKETCQFDPLRYLARVNDKRFGNQPGWIVQVWQPCDFLKYLSVVYSQGELLNALRELANPSNRTLREQADRRRVGATKNKMRAQRTAEAQRAMFERYRNGEVSKDKEDYSLWDKNTLINHIAGLNRRITGWSVRSLQKNLARIEFPKRCVPRVSPGAAVGENAESPENEGHKLCPPK